MEMNQTPQQQNAIREGILVRLTEKKIKELASKNELSYFPKKEGRVKRVFSSFNPIYAISFGGDDDRFLPHDDIEPVN